MLSHDRLDRLGGFICMVEGDSGYEMGYNVSFDDAVEKKAADGAGFPIDGCGAAAGKCPSSSFVVRNGRIRVLKCNLIRSVKFWRSALGTPTKPVIHPQIRNNIPHGNTAPCVPTGPLRTVL